METRKFTPEEAERFILLELSEWVREDAERAGADQETISDAIDTVPNLVLESIKESPIREK